MVVRFLTTISILALLSSCGLRDGERTGVVYYDNMVFDVLFYRGIMRDEIYTETKGGLPEFSHVAEGFSTKITVNLRVSNTHKTVGHTVALEAAHKYCSRHFWKTLPDYRASDPKTYGLENESDTWIFVGVCE